MTRLLHSSKWWVAVTDAVLSVVLYFVGKYAGPSTLEDVKYVIAALQPVFIALIAAICAEDVASRRGSRS